MKIKINLNNLKYRYDVYQLFNIYFPLSEIKFVDDECNYSFYIDDKIMRFSHEKYVKEESLGDNIKQSLRRFVFSCLKEITKDEYPWGILIGIRPSKIALKLIQEGKNEKEIMDIFKNDYLANEDKAKICLEVAKSEEKFVNKKQDKISIYIGMAFCPTKCLYCSFTSNSIVGNKKMVEPYLDALIKEIKGISSYVKEKNLEIETVYFGGGTPTSVNDQQFKSVMTQIYNGFIKEKNVKEFTVECGRPDTITLDKLQTMKAYDVTRISINPQTMNDETLNLIGRKHTVDDIKEKFKMARELGFDDINMDIIIGLPGEGHEELIKTRDELIKLNPDSITVHGLCLKRGSIMYENFILKKGLDIPRQEEIIKMYEESRNLAKHLNISPYYMYRQKNMIGNMENVGYAKKGKECIYNIEMIEEKQTVIALGADAVSKIIFLDEDRIERFANLKDIREYVNRVDEMIDKKIKLLNTLY
ncbi:UNVERIFIED_ORG: coproporphyrinogen III oxidase [Clostridium botulinum]|uniref:coproporphyrinogen III oxidase n=1 Tax=Clostridium botulinum TaxID=1491 RepID=UPI0007739D66|nr:coproporphyrinogen III oxidase [Clostridium botulinum]NFE95502.1 coproporphyrinogen III oxidase [Clostridium botulinum]NFL38832.1 coproporphyrinogen III oxidase [Clostridium botulinum]NFL64982.1 coproporphyrinogen III oxidase [Clostridium botulinum]NFN08512.1 coproporphyrinogen III oxidase [Clostridium botulinum]NFN24705.1 coproporphyrinogen III oxidase [Clostridium botulinum]